MAETWIGEMVGVLEVLLDNQCWNDAVIDLVRQLSTDIELIRKREFSIEFPDQELMRKDPNYRPMLELVEALVDGLSHGFPQLNETVSFEEAISFLQTVTDQLLCNQYNVEIPEKLVLWRN